MRADKVIAVKAVCSFFGPLGMVQDDKNAAALYGGIIAVIECIAKQADVDNPSDPDKTFIWQCCNKNLTLKDTLKGIIIIWPRFRSMVRKTAIIILM